MRERISHQGKVDAAAVVNAILRGNQLLKQSLEDCWQKLEEVPAEALV
jgi:hypothetical protein